DKTVLPLSSVAANTTSTSRGCAIVNVTRNAFGHVWRHGDRRLRSIAESASNKMAHLIGRIGPLTDCGTTRCAAGAAFARARARSISMVMANTLLPLRRRLIDRGESQRLPDDGRDHRRCPWRLERHDDVDPADAGHPGRSAGGPLLEKGNRRT